MPESFFDEPPRKDPYLESMLLERDRIIQDLSVLLEHERTCTGGQVLRVVRNVRSHVCPPGTLLVIPANERYAVDAGDEPLTFAVVRPKKASYEFEQQ